MEPKDNSDLSYNFKITESFASYISKKIGWKLLSFVQPQSSKKRSGQQMAVFANEHISHHVQLAGYYEADELLAIKSFLHSKNLLVDGENSFIDIGANIGNHSLFFSDTFKNVHAFEPNPSAYSLLKANASLCRSSNIETYMIGLGDQKCSTTLYASQGNAGASTSIKENKRLDSISITMHIDRLDSYINSLGDVRCIKIDVEGMELQVLQGSQETINKFKPLIIFEDHVHRSGGKSFDFLHKNGYVFYEVTHEDTSKLIARRLWESIKSFASNKTKRFIQIKKISTVMPKTYKIVLAVHKTKL